MDKFFKIIIIYFCLFSNAHAYIDPGIFAFMWQFIILALVTVLAFIKNINKKIKKIKKIFKKK